MINSPPLFLFWSPFPLLRRSLSLKRFFSGLPLIIFSRATGAESISSNCRSAPILHRFLSSLAAVAISTQHWSLLSGALQQPFPHLGLDDLVA